MIYRLIIILMKKRKRTVQTTKKLIKRCNALGDSGAELKDVLL